MALTVSQRIKTVYHNLSKRHKRIANLILREPDHVSTYSCKQLSLKANVSDSTVARFTSTIGYDTFLEFKQALNNELHDKLPDADRISLTIDSTKQRDLFQKALLMDISNLKYTADHMDMHTLEDIVDFTINSKKKYIIGIGKDEILARLLYENFASIFDNVNLITSGDDWYSQLMSITKKDVVIMFSVTQRNNSLVGLSDFLMNRCVPLILITNHESSPITEFTRLVIAAKSNSLSFRESLTAAVSVVNALTIEVMKRDRVRISTRNDQLKKIRSEYER